MNQPNSQPIKLVSVNIEGSRHSDRVDQFLATQQPHIACLQEVESTRLQHFATQYPYYHFAPMNQRPNGSLQGVAILSKVPYLLARTIPFAGSDTYRQPFDRTSFQSRYESQQYVACLVECAIGDTAYRFVTTHLPVTEAATVTEYQRYAMRQLCSALAPFDHLIVTGDMNAPRGGAIFTQLTKQYTDHVPSHYTTSIDPKLHRAGSLELMVDGLFSTEQYQVTNVELHTGVSDHQAITATIVRN